MRVFNFKTVLLVAALTLVACEQVGDLINPKHPPELDAQGIVLSQDQVMPRDTVTASIKATNPLDGPLQFEWQADGGNFLPPFDSDTVLWVAPLSGGLYHLWVTVSNEDGKTTSPKKQINVISTSQPIVNILQPPEGKYFVVGQTCTVKVKAEHENGIALVRLWVNQQFMGAQDAAPAGYFEFAFKVTESMVGKTLLRAQAVARNQLQSTGEDETYIFVGGIVPGGNERSANH